MAKKHLVCRLVNGDIGILRRNFDTGQPPICIATIHRGSEKLSDETCSRLSELIIHILNTDSSFESFKELALIDMEEAIEKFKMEMAETK